MLSPSTGSPRARSPALALALGDGAAATTEALGLAEADGAPLEARGFDEREMRTAIPMITTMRTPSAIVFERCMAVRPSTEAGACRGFRTHLGLPGRTSVGRVADSV